MPHYGEVRETESEGLIRSEGTRGLKSLLSLTGIQAFLFSNLTCSLQTAHSDFSLSELLFLCWLLFKGAMSFYVFLLTFYLCMFFVLSVHTIKVNVVLAFIV